MRVVLTRESLLRAAKAAVVCGFDTIKASGICFETEADVDARLVLYAIDIAPVGLVRVLQREGLYTVEVPS